MKFDEKYPDAKRGFAIDEYIVPALKEHQNRPCVVCGDETKWFHRKLIVHVCSDECVRQLLSAN